MNLTGVYPKHKCFIFFYFALGQHASRIIRKCFFEKNKKFLEYIFFILYSGLGSALLHKLSSLPNVLDGLWIILRMTLLLSVGMTILWPRLNIRLFIIVKEDHNSQYGWISFENNRYLRRQPEFVICRYL